MEDLTGFAHLCRARSTEVPLRGHPSRRPGDQPPSLEHAVPRRRPGFKSKRRRSTQDRRRRSRRTDAARRDEVPLNRRSCHRRHHTAKDRIFSASPSRSKHCGSADRGEFSEFDCEGSDRGKERRRRDGKRGDTKARRHNAPLEIG